MDTFLIKALQLILSLSILVLIHEFGHYFFSRVFKVRVEKFYMFFHPWFKLLKYNPDNKGKKWSFFCANDTVGKLSAGDAFCGYVLDVAKDGAACVALHGYVQLPYSGDAPALGWSGLCADGSGGVKADDTGKSYLVIHVDTADGTVGFFL